MLIHLRPRNRLTGLNLSRQNSNQTQHCLANGLTDRFWLLAGEIVCIHCGIACYQHHILYVLSGSLNRGIQDNSRLFPMLSLPTSTAGLILRMWCIFTGFCKLNMSQQKLCCTVQYIKARQRMKTLPLEGCIPFTSDDWNGLIVFVISSC